MISYYTLHINNRVPPSDNNEGSNENSNNGRNNRGLFGCLGMLMIFVIIGITLTSYYRESNLLSITGYIASFIIGLMFIGTLFNRKV